jgi:two-component system nitrate/nitrite response regulator NarL
LREGIVCILQSSCFNVVAAAAYVDEALSQISCTEGEAIDLLICSLDPDRSIEPQLDAIRAVRQRDACTKVVMLMPSCTAEDLIAAVLCGADGVILKDISGDKLIAALDLVMHGQHVLPLGVASQVFSNRQMPLRNEEDDQPVRLPGGTGVAANLSFAAKRELPSGQPAAGPSVFKTADEAGSQGCHQQEAPRSLNLSEREKQILQCLVEGSANKLIARRLEIAEATVKVHIKGLLRKINVSNRTQAAIWALNQSVAARPAQSATPAGSTRRPADHLEAFDHTAETRPANALLPDLIAVLPAGPGGLPPQNHA